MMVFEITDILFFIKSLKEPTDYFGYVSFSSGRTCLSTHLKLRHASATINNSSKNLYFNRLPGFGTLSPFWTLIQSIATIKTKLYQHFWRHFTANFDPDNNICSYHYPYIMSLCQLQLPSCIIIKPRCACL